MKSHRGDAGEYLNFLCLAAVVLTPASLTGATTPDFNRDIRPILSDKCFRCHGPDERERKGGDHGLRLDTAKGATEDLGGYHAIVPGNLEKSELITRVVATDDEDIMPPRKTGKTLSASEIDLLKRWIASGATYAAHWSYDPPSRTALPVVKDRAWSRNALDRFILARLEQAGLRPQPEAERTAIARRVALDLTGLPPSIEEADAFAQDRNRDAYEQFVDRQLAKPAYGEHWARAWLDLARYADSRGYADDQPRSIWRYRDYVIDAFNRNMPFDRFTIEQLAGDLLPDATSEQLFATGFHRNTMNNTEGGTDDEEFRSVAVVDRVNTTMAVWMGTSMACAQCHTHKYDPLTQKEYFQLYAIFNQSEDADRDDETPVLEFYTHAQKAQRTEWEAEIAALKRQVEEKKPVFATAAESWAERVPVRIDWQFPKPGTLTSEGKAAMKVLEDGSVLVEPGRKKDTYTVEVPVPEATAITGVRLQALPDNLLPGGGPGGAGGNFVVTRVRVGIKPAEAFRWARYVRVELPNDGRPLELAEVEIFSAGQNIALRGVASQSSTFDGAEAGRANDGRTNGSLTEKSVSQTEVTGEHWWQIDLGETLPLERIVVWSRTDGETTLRGFRVAILDEQKRPVFEQIPRDPPQPSKVIKLDDPRDVRMTGVFVDPAQPEFDEAYVIADRELKRSTTRKKRGAKRGWAAAEAIGRPHTLSLLPSKPFALQPGEKLVVTIEQQSTVEHATLNHFRVGVTLDPRSGEHLRTPAAVIAAARIPVAERDTAQRDLLLDYYIRQIAPELQTERERLGALERSLEDMPINSSPIMRDLAGDKRRKTHIQLRGNFLALGEEVAGGVPAVFPPLPAEAPVNRLTLARWLVDPANPLTARVLANRLWEAIFGIGIVRTAEEFGSQGEPPTHPELLDWLALDLIESKWDTKQFLKNLVMSAAYRQSSRVTPKALALDPENRLVSRGPRFRLGAEMVRDQALAVSGLLSPKIHGPSARPFQPAFGLRAAFGSTLDWKTSAGDERFRRGLYTDWRRSSPYPSMVAFDAPNREVCTLRRNRSNTPLQALVTLNDPVFVEAAQALARIIAAGSGSIENKVRDGFRRVIVRPPTRAEVARLVALHASALATYSGAPDKAAALIANPENPPPPTFAPAELAAWTTVANVLLNLDEALMKR